MATQFHRISFRTLALGVVALGFLGSSALAQDGFGQSGWQQGQAAQQSQTWGGQQGHHGQQQPQWGGQQPGNQQGWGQPQGQWPQAPAQQPDPWGHQPHGGWGQPAPGQGLGSIAPPQYMDRRNSQAGHVFYTRMPGTGARMQVGRLREHMRSYFDSDIQIMAEQSDPSDQYAQIGFSAFKNGVMVMGMLVVSPGAPGEMAGALVLDEFDRFQASFPMMLQALQEG